MSVCLSIYHCYKELAHVIGVGKASLNSTGQDPGLGDQDHGQAGGHRHGLRLLSQEDFFSFWDSLSPALQAFQWTDQAHPDSSGGISLI